MKAKIQPRIDLKNRTKIEKIIPLTIPFIIFIDPADICNFQCKFCPTGDRDLMKKTPGRNYGTMDLELFKKIVDDICEFEKPIKVLRLYKDGEPLLNKNFPEMIKYAREKTCAQRIDTTTNASLLTPELTDKIIDAGGLDRINISIEGVNSKQYLKFSKYKIKFTKLVENIRYFYNKKKNCEMIIKTNGDLLSENDKKRFYEIFGDIADGVFIEHIMSCWPGFEMESVEANKECGIYGQEIKEVMVCPYVFYSFSINSNGSASACFLDWSRKLLIGDIKTQKIRDIWFGKEMLNFQKMFLKKKRKEHRICTGCGQLSHGYPDDIDTFAENLLEKLKTK